MKKSVLLAIIILTFVACDKNDDSPTLLTESFESITLNSEGLNQNNEESGSIACDDLSLSCSWKRLYFNGSSYNSFTNGFTISNQTDTTDANIVNKFSCVAQSGANNSENYAVFVDKNDYYTDSLKFDSPVDMESVMICNSAYAYKAFSYGAGYSIEKYTDDDYCYVTLTLYDENGSSLGNENFYLADFTNGNSTIVTDWTKLDLSTYKGVSHIKFSFSASKSAPDCFCIDDIAYYATEVE